MWGESFVARFTYHRRSSPANANSPLIPRHGDSEGGPYPISSYRALAPVQTGPEVPTEATNGPDIPITSAKGKRPSRQSHPVAIGHCAAEQAVDDIEVIHLSGKRSFRSFFMEELDTTRSVAPLSAYCFMTGFMDAISFSAIFVWCAFQTGNSLQLSFALARLINGRPFRIADQQALCAVFCFIAGAFIGRIGDKVGCKTRAWMTFGTLLQTMFVTAAAIAIWKSGSGAIGNNPAWSGTVSFVTLGLMSACMGLQGIMGKRLNTHFSTTVVLTSTWCELVTEPQLFDFRHFIPARDHKVMAILFLFLGGFTSRVILDHVGSAGVLGVGAGLRFVIALWWLLVPAKKAE